MLTTIIHRCNKYQKSLFYHPRRFLAKESTKRKRDELSSSSENEVDSLLGDLLMTLFPSVVVVVVVVVVVEDSFSVLELGEEGALKRLDFKRCTLCRKLL